MTRSPSISIATGLWSAAVAAGFAIGLWIGGRSSEGSGGERLAALEVPREGLGKESHANVRDLGTRSAPEAYEADASRAIATAGAAAASSRRALPASGEALGDHGLVGLLGEGEALSAFDPHEATLAIELLLELGRPLDAYAILRAGPADTPYAYSEVGRALAERGHAAEASYLFSESLRRGEWDEDVIDDFVALDPAQCLAAIDREGAFWAREGYLTEDEENAFRAQALQALGRSEEAVVLLVDDEPRFVESSGCVPGHIEGEGWKWRAWLAVDPRRVEPLLLEALDVTYAKNMNALELVAELYVEEGRLEELEAVVAAWSTHHDSSGDLGWMTLQLAPQRGWDTARAFLEQHPAHADVAWGLGEHLLRIGREQEAVELLGDFLEVSWVEHRDVDELVETCRLAPGRLAPALDRLVSSARADFEDSSERSEALGDLGDAHWDLGDRERAQALWREAHALDPEQGWSWSLRQAELGVDPRW